MTGQHHYQHAGVTYLPNTMPQTEQHCSNDMCSSTCLCACMCLVSKYDTVSCLIINFVSVCHIFPSFGGCDLASLSTLCESAVYFFTSSP